MSMTIILQLRTMGWASGDAANVGFVADRVVHQGSSSLPCPLPIYSHCNLPLSLLLRPRLIDWLPAGVSSPSDSPG